MPEAVFHLSTFGRREHFVVSVADLPWPGNPGNASSWCALNAYAAELNSPPRRGRGRYAPPMWTELQTLNERLITSRSQADLAACWFHRQRWDVISGIAVGVIRRQVTTDEARLRGWAQRHGLDQEVVDLAFELLGTYAPLKWNRGDTSLSNGQHRVCAMKMQGVRETVVLGCR